MRNKFLIIAGISLLLVGMVVLLNSDEIQNYRKQTALNRNRPIRNYPRVRLGKVVRIEIISDSPLSTQFVTVNLHGIEQGVLDPYKLAKTEGQSVWVVDAMFLNMHNPNTITTATAQNYYWLVPENEGINYRNLVE